MRRVFFTKNLFLKKFEFVLVASIIILINCFMIVESSITLELFYDCGKTFLIVEKITGVIILRQWRYVVFDSAIIKLPLFILSVLTRLTIVKTRHYQPMGLQKQWDRSFMAVETLLWGGVRHINRTYQYTSFSELQVRYMSRDTHLKCLSPLEKPSTSLDKGRVGSIWWPMEWHEIL